MSILESYWLKSEAASQSNELFPFQTALIPDCPFYTIKYFPILWNKGGPIHKNSLDKNSTLTRKHKEYIGVSIFQELEIKTNTVTQNVIIFSF